MDVWLKIVKSVRYRLTDITYYCNKTTSVKLNKHPTNSLPIYFHHLNSIKLIYESESFFIMESLCGFSTHCISWELWFPIPGKKILTLRINERKMVSDSVKHFYLGLHVVSKQKFWVHNFTELWRPEVARRWKKFDFCVFFGKTTPYGKIFTTLFRKYSSRHRSTCCVQISWHLADGKSVKLCVAYLTKKTK